MQYERDERDTQPDTVLAGSTRFAGTQQYLRLADAVHAGADGLGKWANKCAGDSAVGRGSAGLAAGNGLWTKENRKGFAGSGDHLSVLVDFGERRSGLRKSIGHSA